MYNANANSNNNKQKKKRNNEACVRCTVNVCAMADVVVVFVRSVFFLCGQQDERKVGVCQLSPDSLASLSQSPAELS